MMRIGLPWFAALVVMCFSLGAARADIPGPGPRPRPPFPPRERPEQVATEPTAPLTILTDDNAKEPRLIIPRKLLASWDKPSNERGMLELSPVHTMIAGLSLSGALVLGGLWLVRGRGRLGARGLAVLIGTAILLGVGVTAVWANRPPPPPREKPVTVDGVTFDKVQVEITDKGDSVRLILNKSHLAKVSEQPQR